MVGPEEACREKEAAYHWPKDIIPAPTDPAVVGRIEALETQVQSLQQEVASLVEFTTPPDLSINDISLIECGNGDIATLTVSLTKPAQYVVTADYQTLDGDATSAWPSDYYYHSGVLEFQPGETVKTIDTQIRCEAAPELDEVFYVELTNVQYANPIKTSGRIELLNDDLATMSLNLLTQLPTFYSTWDPMPIAAEGTSVDFKVTINVSPYPISVSYSVIGDALGTIGAHPAAIGDFSSALTGELVFLPGEHEKIITVYTMDDQVAEGIEGFMVMLSDPVNATFAGGAGSIASSVALNDDDVQLAISVSAASVTEGTVPITKYQSEMPSSSSFSLSVTLSEAVEGPVWVDVLLDSDLSTAETALDYVRLGYGSSYGYFGWTRDLSFSLYYDNYYNYTIRVAPGEASATKIVYLLSDNIQEEDELAVFKMSQNWGATAPNVTSTPVAILDDD
jgi:hypothetical protein